MNYLHHFHAGNHADVFKHIVLLRLMARLQQKPGGILVLDTHAGAGLYDLQASEARRSAEAEGGIRRLAEVSAAEAPEEVMAYRRLVESFGRGLYPGSPALAVKQLRAQDRYLGFEAVSAVQRELQRHLGDLPTPGKVRTSLGDGLAALKANLPPTERRGLILIDPPYEQKGERDAIVTAIGEGLRRFETGVYALWYPVKQREQLDRWLRKIARLTARPVLSVSFSVLPDQPGNALTGSGMLIINPPWGLDEELKPVLTFLNRLLREDPTAGFDLTWLNPAS